MNDDVPRELYDELHRLAAAHMRRERTSHTLQTTALVHEAYLRLAKQVEGGKSDRGHLLALAARTMRRILIDHARRRAAAKRGGGARRITIQAAPGSEAPDVDLLALDEGLEELHELDEQKCRIVELMFFAGLSTEEVADLLGMARRTVQKHWALARAWLRVRLEGPLEV